MNKIVISTSSFGKYDNSPLEFCKENGYKVVLNPYMRKVKPHELIELARNAVGLIAGTEIITEDILSKLSFLKVISRCGVGLDNIDIDAAKRLGIEVFNTPDVPTLAVAELTVELILNLLRKVNPMDRALRKGIWEKQMGNLLYRKKVGILGFGRIGRKVAELLKPFHCEISYADPFVEDGILGLNRLSKQDLLGWSDIVSIHVSEKDRILGKKEIGLMKKGVWLVNTSRGEVIDEDALYCALKEGYFSGAAIDVFNEEPYQGLLKELDNVVLTPHIGSYAKEVRVEMEMQAVKNLLTGLSE